MTAVRFLANLNWKPHITGFSKKLARTVRIFDKIRHLAPSDTLKIVHFLFFIPVCPLNTVKVEHAFVNLTGQIGQDPTVSDFH